MGWEILMYLKFSEYTSSMPIRNHFSLCVGKVRLNLRLNIFSMSLSQPFHELAGFETISITRLSYQRTSIPITCKANINK